MHILTVHFWDTSYRNTLIFFLKFGYELQLKDTFTVCTIIRKLDYIYIYIYIISDTSFPDIWNVFVDRICAQSTDPAWSYSIVW